MKKILIVLAAVMSVSSAALASHNDLGSSNSMLRNNSDELFVTGGTQQSVQGLKVIIDDLIETKTDQANGLGSNSSQ